MKCQLEVGSHADISLMLDTTNLCCLIDKSYLIFFILFVCTGGWYDFINSLIQSDYQVGSSYNLIINDIIFDVWSIEDFSNPN